MTSRALSLFSAAARLAAATAAAALSGCVTHSGGRSGDPDRVTRRFRAGPLFEWHDTADGGSFWAVRPLWSRETAPSRESNVQDFAWPLATRHSEKGNLWWRALNAYGHADASSPEYSFMFFPLWHQGADRAGDFRWGLFPLYGRHHHILFMDNVEYALFPLYLGYDVNGEPRRYALWPVFSWEPERGSFGAWPFFGMTHRRESTNWYTAWPIVTWSEHFPDRDTSGAGGSWMFWPLCARVSRERETQTMILPPFFGYARTPYAERWRMPWPLFERYRAHYKDSWLLWPFWYASDLRAFDSSVKLNDAPEDEKEPDVVTRHYIWWLVTDEVSKTARRRTESFRVFPFWTSEKTYEIAPDGTEKEIGSYRRVWPFWSSETDRGVNRQRALELCPIRHVPAIDRNWAPFWTLWDSDGREDGSAVHSWLWGLIQYEVDAPEESGREGGQP